MWAMLVMLCVANMTQCSLANFSWSHDTYATEGACDAAAQFRSTTNFGVAIRCVRQEEN
jgi:hypothetical protein